MPVTLDRPRLVGPPIADDATRRQFLTGLGAAALLVACGGSGDGSPTELADGEVREVEHLRGVARIQGRPERVVILDNAMVGYLIPFDVEPVGVGASSEDETLLPLYEPFVDYDAPPLVAPEFTPNFEAIAAARPDVIFALNFYEEGDYERLEEIAPTVVVNNDGAADGKAGAWYVDNLRLVAQALGRTDEIQEPIDEYRDRIEELRDRFGDVIDRTEVSFVRANSPGEFRIDGAAGFGGSILAEVGFARPAAQTEALEQGTDPGALDFFPVVDLPVEQLALADADLVIVSSLDGENPLAAEPLWPTLRAVEAGRVVVVDAFIWGSRSLVGAMLVLDDLDRILTKLA